MGFSEFQNRNSDKIHVHFEIKDVGSLGNQDDHSGPYWGYTPGHPDLYGYQDPRYLVGNITVESITPVVLRNPQPRVLRIRSNPGTAYENKQTSIIGQLGENQEVVTTKRALVGDTYWYFVDLPSRNSPFVDNGINNGRHGGWIYGGETVEDQSATQLRIVANEYNVRSGPGNGNSIIAKVYAGQRFVVAGASTSGSGCSGEWYPVFVPGNSSVSATTGWICSDGTSQEANPDLNISFISLPPDVMAMKSANVELEITNVGDLSSASGNLQVGLFVLSEDLQLFQADLLDLGALEAIEPGQVRTVSFQYTFISNAYSDSLVVTLIPEAGMDANLQNNTKGIKFTPLPNQEVYLNCIGEITTVLSLGLIQGTEDLDFAKEIIFYFWDNARNSLSQAWQERDVKKIVIIFGELAWDTAKIILKLTGKKLIGSVFSFIKSGFSLLEAAKNEATFQGCGEVLPRAWDTLKELPKLLFKRIKEIGETIFFFILDSPADIIVEDSGGNITFVTQDSISENIENSFAFTFNGHKAIAIIGNDDYMLRIKGTGTGEAGLSVFNPKNAVERNSPSSIPTL